jgi:hypothetical protein
LAVPTLPTANRILPTVTHCNTLFIEKVVFVTPLFHSFSRYTRLYTICSVQLFIAGAIVTGACLAGYLTTVSRNHGSAYDALGVRRPYLTASRHP